MTWNMWQASVSNQRRVSAAAPRRITPTWVRLSASQASNGRPRIARSTLVVRGMTGKSTCPRVSMKSCAMLAYGASKACSSVTSHWLSITP
ncbi:hypothetical protein D9M72_365200 [compost metagenome]